MSRSCRNTREQWMIQETLMQHDLDRIFRRKDAERFEWTGNIKVYYPASVAK